MVNNLKNNEFDVKFPAVSNLFIYLTCLYVIIWYLQLGTRIDFFGKIRFEFLLGGFLSLFALMKFQSSTGKPSPISSYVKLFFVVVIIQIPFSYAFSTSLDTFINRVFKFSLLALFISSFILSPKALKFLLIALFIAWMKLCQEGFLGWLTGSLVWQNQGIMRLHGSISVLAHPNSFSGFAVGLMPFIYFLFPVAPKLGKLFLLAMTVFAMIIIIFTGSRTGYVAFFGFLFYVFWNSKNKLKYTLVFIMLFLIGLPFVPEQYKERFESIYTLEEKAGNSSGTRIQILEDAVSIFFDHPFGVGVRAFPSIRMDTFGRLQDTHNLYLEILTNLGIQGFIVFVLLILSIFKMLKVDRDKLISLKDKVNKKFTDFNSDLINDDIDFTIAVSKAVAAFLVVRLYLGLFGMDLYEIYWWLAIGLAISIHRIVNGYNEFFETMEVKDCLVKDE